MDDEPIAILPERKSEQNPLDLTPQVRKFENQNSTLPNELGPSLDALVQQEAKNQDSRIKDSKGVVLPGAIFSMFDRETAASINRVFSTLVDYSYRGCADYRFDLIPDSIQPIEKISFITPKDSLDSFTAYFDLQNTKFPIQITKNPDGTFSFHKDQRDLAPIESYMREMGRYENIIDVLGHLAGQLPREGSNPFDVAADSVSYRQRQFAILTDALGKNPIGTKAIEDYKYRVKTNYRLTTAEELQENIMPTLNENKETLLSQGLAEFSDEGGIIVIKGMRKNEQYSVSGEPEMLQTQLIITPVIDVLDGRIRGYGSIRVDFDANGNLVFETWNNEVNLEEVKEILPADSLKIMVEVSS